MSTTISENVKEDIYDDELNYIIIDEYYMLKELQLLIIILK